MTRTRRCHARQRLNALERARVEVVRDGQVAIVGLGQIHPQRQDLRGIESLVEMMEPPRRAADEADLRHQDERQRHLRDDERLAQPPPFRRLGAAIALAQLVHIGPRHAQRRQQREAQRRHERQRDAHRKDAAVQGHFGEAVVIRAGKADGDDSPPCEEQSNRTGGRRRDETFDDELPDLLEAPAPSAERTASSRRRVAACARMMLETFANAMQTTITAINARRDTTAVMLPPSRSRSGRTTTPLFVLVSG